MTQFGKTLRQAREAKGMTVAQIAKSTRLMSTMVEDLENENFSKIVAPIYGRGFVKLYCEAVGLDPKPFIAEFMDLFSGNRTTAAKDSPKNAPVEPPVSSIPPPPPVAAVVPPPPPIAPTPPPQPAASVPEPPPVRFPFAAETPAAVAPAPVAPTPAPAAPTPAPVAPAPETATPASTPEKPHRSHPSRFAPAYAQEPPKERPQFHLPKMPSIPAFFWRIGILVLAALIVLWLLMIGLRALYRATTGTPERAPMQEAITAEVSAKPIKGQEPKSAPAPNPIREKRTPQDIPDLYID